MRPPERIIHRRTPETYQGSRAWRQANVLARLDQTDLAALEEALSDRMQV